MTQPATKDLLHSSGMRSAWHVRALQWQMLILSQGTPWVFPHFLKASITTHPQTRTGQSSAPTTEPMTDGHHFTPPRLGHTCSFFYYLGLGLGRMLCKVGSPEILGLMSVGVGWILGCNSWVQQWLVGGFEMLQILYSSCIGMGRWSPITCIFLGGSGVAPCSTSYKMVASSSRSLSLQ